MLERFSETWRVMMLRSHSESRSTRRRGSVLSAGHRSSPALAHSIPTRVRAAVPHWWPPAAEHKHLPTAGPAHQGGRAQVPWITHFPVQHSSCKLPLQPHSSFFPWRAQPHQGFSPSQSLQAESWLLLLPPGHSPLWSSSTRRRSYCLLQGKEWGTDSLWGRENRGCFPGLHPPSSWRAPPLSYWEPSELLLVQDSCVSALLNAGTSVHYPLNALCQSPILARLF